MTDVAKKHPEHTGAQPQAEKKSAAAMTEQSFYDDYYYSDYYQFNGSYSYDDGYAFQEGWGILQYYSGTQCNGTLTQNYGYRNGACIASGQLYYYDDYSSESIRVVFNNSKFTLLSNNTITKLSLFTRQLQWYRVKTLQRW